jgi:hypothetical protein
LELASAMVLVSALASVLESELASAMVSASALELASVLE